ncbi:MAG: tRNA (5-methylaminomethyl-2-thiouridine)(34)-methyltransferase MnmD, partial [Flavobacteriales bacterium]
FIRNGVELKKNQNDIRVLEMGLGTGLNAYLTMVWARSYPGNITYYGIEAYPVEGSVMRSCLQAAGATDTEELAFFSQTVYGQKQSIHNFTLVPVHAAWEAIRYDNEFDVVYYDAFGPRAQEAMWSMDNLGRAHCALKQGGLLTTYCAKGQVKRNLKELGFDVISLPGPAGKREMTQAIKV